MINVSLVIAEHPKNCAFIMWSSHRVTMLAVHAQITEVCTLMHFTHR